MGLTTRHADLTATPPALHVGWKWPSGARTRSMPHISRMSAARLDSMIGVLVAVSATCLIQLVRVDPAAYSLSDLRPVCVVRI
ncbi:hypothetical protein BDZ89DRAFT_798055 [Hymenopellis radicata]|nr:hypothetical protein BDZ89DRAFT_798055 [Hymenopellis radicata]